MRLALAQINTVVGDLDGNAARIVGRVREARDAGADLVLFPELAVTGYPPEDLLFRPEFLRQAGGAGEWMFCGRPGAASIGSPARRRTLPRSSASRGSSATSSTRARFSPAARSARSTR